ncbi:MAG: DNA methyltransferase, partial [Dehalococcoidia bacterium]
CGAPYQRIVEASGGTKGQSWNPHLNDPETGNTMSDELRAKTLDGTYRREFKGWQPGCKCGEKERVPCLVLDPFMGSGTVAVVSRELNRSSVGCELNPAYVEIIKKRLNAGSQLDTGVVSYRFEKVSGTAGTNSKVR